MSNHPIYVNPYYNPSDLKLEQLSFEDPGACYSFDTLAFWTTEDGRVFTARDSGCSCPTPFEDYCGTTQDEVLAKLERVGSLEQAEAAFDSWGLLGADSKRELTEWIKARLKS